MPQFPQRRASRRPLVLALALLLGVAGVAAARAPLASHAVAQEPVTWRLVRVGTDPLPLVMSTGDDGRPLLQLVEETLVLGPGDRAARVTLMRAEVYERMPCALIAQLREAERRQATGDTSRATPAPPTDTSAATCAALRLSRDSVVGRVAQDGGQRWVAFEPAAGRTREPRALVVQRGDTLELRAGATSARDGGLSMRYVRARARR